VTDELPVLWEGDSLEILSSLPKDVKQELGADLDRVQNGERPLDSGSLTNVLPKVFYLRGDDKDFWYRVPYINLDGIIYVLDCFKKKTNQISQREINTIKVRLTDLKARLALEKKQTKKK
jgi:phage-related protein